MLPEPRHQEFWQSYYESGDLPWDLQGPSPHFAMGLRRPEFSDAFPRPPAALFVPGAGRGHDAVYFAESGYRVTCLDLAPSAPLRASEAYPALIPARIRYEVGNLFELYGDLDWKDRFDGAAEHTCFCAIPPTLREDYVKTAAWVLKPGGVLFGVFWNHPMPNGPPYSTELQDLNRLFTPDFELVSRMPCPQTAGGRPGTEHIYLWRKRPRN